MRAKRFLTQLGKQLPVWAEKGWFDPQYEQEVLDYVAAQARDTSRAPLAFGILGVVLLGAGVITFIAANWDAMSKAAKLAVLFVAFWSAYAGGAWMLKGDRYPLMGQSVLLLGVILFGANIILIAQIYHIDAHYPDGVLTWALGALIVLLLCRVQSIAFAGLLLAGLWSGMEIVDFQVTIHWQFLIVWAAFVAVVQHHRWRASLHLSMLVMIVWLILTTASFEYSRSFAVISLVRIYAVMALALYVGGTTLRSYDSFEQIGEVLRGYAVIIGLLAFNTLCFPELHKRAADTDLLAMSWIVATVAAILVLAGSSIWYRVRIGSDRGTEPYRIIGWIVVGLIVAALLGTMAVRFDPSATAILFRLLYFAAVVWLTYAGYQGGSRTLVNTAFAFFIIGLVHVYFETLWTLFDRSFFFMAGGALLIVGGYLLERQRLRLMRRMVGPGEGEA